MKYPLSPEARTVAAQLVEAWDEDSAEQLWDYMAMRAGGRLSCETLVSLNSPGRTISVPRRILKELATYGLIRLDRSSNDGFEVLFLQELRNAVENEFEVSDYFITMNAVGNIIVNSTTGPVQGVGYSTGIVHQGVEQLADYMSATLGEAFLQTQTDLKAAIDAMREATEADQQSKLGKVVSQLGNCLEHGANTAAVVAALTAAAPFIQRILSG